MPRTNDLVAIPKLSGKTLIAVFKHLSAKLESDLVKRRKQKDCGDVEMPAIKAMLEVNSRFRKPCLWILKKCEDATSQAERSKHALAAISTLRQLSHEIKRIAMKTRKTNCEAIGLAFANALSAVNNALSMASVAPTKKQVLRIDGNKIADDVTAVENTFKRQLAAIRQDVNQELRIQEYEVEQLWQKVADARDERAERKAKIAKGERVPATGGAKEAEKAWKDAKRNLKMAIARSSTLHWRNFKVSPHRILLNLSSAFSVDDLRKGAITAATMIESMAKELLAFAKAQHNDHANAKRAAQQAAANLLRIAKKTRAVV